MQLLQVLQTTCRARGGVGIRKMQVQMVNSVLNSYMLVPNRDVRPFHSDRSVVSVGNNFICKQMKAEESKGLLFRAKVPGMSDAFSLKRSVVSVKVSVRSEIV